MMITSAISGSDRLNLDSIKHASSFLGIILNIILVVQVSHCMCLFPYPMNWKDPVLSATYVWFEIEWGIFLGTVISTTLFLVLRSSTHHKLQLDEIPVKKQLPDIDTVIAIKNLSDEFVYDWVPFLISLYLYIQPNDSNTGYSKI